MAKQGNNKSLPNSGEVKDSYRDPAKLVVLGDSAVDYVLANQYKYDPKWFECLWTAVGTLKDAIESRTRINSAAAELSILLLRPKEVSRTLSRAEVADIIEPTEEQSEAWAWGSDLAKTTKWFATFVVLGILAFLAFAIVTFGLESPGNTMSIMFISIASVILAGATSILGIGLYKHYVIRGYLDWDYRGYPVAEIKRSKKFYKQGGWYSYAIGGIFLALSVALAIIVG